MDFKDPTLTKIKQESEDFNEDVPDFVKIEPGEIKDLALNKFEFESSGNVKIESGEVKDLSNNSSAVLKQEMDFDMKVNSLNDLPMNKFEFVSTGEVSFPNTDIKQEMDIDIKENYLKIEDHFEKENSKANGTTTDSTNRKSLRCELCGTVCHSIDSYSLHMMYQHTGEQPFKCDKCDKAFKTEEELACHTKEHTDSSDSSDSGSSSGHDSGSDSDLVSRPTTKKKKMHLDVQSRQICLNVYNNLQMQNEHLQVEHEEDGMEDVIKETAYLTEIPYSMICQIVREGVPKEKSRSDCDKPRKKINRSST